MTENSPRTTTAQQRVESSVEPSAESGISVLRQHFKDQVNRGRYMLASAVLLYVAACAIFIALLSTVPSLTAGIIPESSGGRKLIGWMATFAASVPFAFASKYLFEAKRCFVKDARLVLLEDERPRILYLRSFSEDETCNPKFGLNFRYPQGLPVLSFSRSLGEQSIARELNRCVGPVVAIGRPGESLPELGAQRFYVSDDKWKDEISRQIQSCRFAIVKVGETEGLSWELMEILVRLAPAAVVLWSPDGVVPPATRDVLATRVEAPIPESHFVVFDSRWNPIGCDSIESVMRYQGVYVERQGFERFCERSEQLLLSARRTSARLAASDYAKTVGIVCLVLVILSLFSCIFVVAFEQGNTAWGSLIFNICIFVTVPVLVIAMLLAVFVRTFDDWQAARIPR